MREIVRMIWAAMRRRPARKAGTVRVAMIQPVYLPIAVPWGTVIECEDRLTCRACGAAMRANMAEIRERIEEGRN